MSGAMHEHQHVLQTCVAAEVLTFTLCKNKAKLQNNRIIRSVASICRMLDLGFYLGCFCCLEERRPSRWNREGSLQDHRIEETSMTGTFTCTFEDKYIAVWAGIVCGCPPIFSFMIFVLWCVHNSMHTKQPKKRGISPFPVMCLQLQPICRQPFTGKSFAMLCM